MIFQLVARATNWKLIIMGVVHHPHPFIRGEGGVFTSWIAGPAIPARAITAFGSFHCRDSHCPSDALSLRWANRQQAIA